MNPIRKEVSVELEPKEAFDLFTTSIGDWWPAATHSLHGAATRVVCDGSRLYEVGPEGQEEVWGEIVAWDPPNGFTSTWHVGRRADESSERVHVSFESGAGGRGTRVVLVHDGWAQGEDERRTNYDAGWDGVLAHFVGSAHGEPSEGR